MSNQRLRLYNNFVIFKSDDNYDTIKDKLIQLISPHSNSLITMKYNGKDNETILEHIMNKHINTLKFNGVYDYVVEIKLDIEEYDKFNKYNISILDFKPTDMFMLVLLM